MHPYPPGAGYIAMPAGGPSVYPPQYQNVPVEPPQDFSWGTQPRHDLIGNRMAANAGALISQVPTGAEAAMQAASAGVMLGSLLRQKTYFPGMVGMSMLDPSYAAMEAGGAAWGATAAMGGTALGTAGRVAIAGTAGLGVGALVAGGWEGAKFGARNIYSGFQQTAQAARMTQGFSFFNGAGNLGRGFSSQESARFGDQLRRMDLADPFTTFGEMGRATEGINAAGMTQGVRDAETASRIVRTQIQTLQQLSRTMGTTLNEALPALRQMRMSGLFTATEQIANVRQMRAADSFGVGQEAFLGMQAAGAQLTRDMQLGGAVGARLSAGTLMGIGTDVQAGRVSREGLLDMTGASTIEEAQTAAASRVSNRISSTIMGTNAGRALLLALGTQKGSKFTGEIDQSRLSAMLSDGTGLRDLSGLSKGKVEGDMKAKASFYTHSEDIAGSLLSANGGQDAVALIGKLAMTEAKGDEDLAKVYLEHLGIRDRRESDLILAAYNNYTARRRETSRRLRQSEQADALRERYKIGITKGVVGKVTDTLAAPFQAGGGAAYASIEHPFEAMSDAWYGVSRFNMDDQTSDALSILGSTTGFGDNFVNNTKRMSYGMGRYMHPGMLLAGERAGRIASDARDSLEMLTPAGMMNSYVRKAHTAVLNGMGVYGPGDTLHQAAYGPGMSDRRVRLSDALLGVGGRIDDDTLRAAGATGVFADRSALDAFVKNNKGTIQGGATNLLMTAASLGSETTLADDLSDMGAGVGSRDLRRIGTGMARVGFKGAGTALSMAGALGGDTARANMTAYAQAYLGDNRGKALMQGLLGPTADASGFLSQEAAKENLHHAAIAAGIYKTDASSMELGGTTTGMFAALARSGKSAQEITKDTNEILKKIRQSDGYLAATDKTEYINTMLAQELSKKYNHTISREDARILQQNVVTNGGGHLDELLKASSAAVNTSFVHSGATNARRSLQQISSTGLLARAGGGEMSAFRSALGDAKGYATAFAGGGATDQLLAKLSQDPSSLDAILNSESTSAPERAIALAARNRAQGRNETADQLFKRYGISEDERGKFKSILDAGGTSALNETLSRLTVQSEIGSDSGGSQMIDSSMSMPQQIMKVAHSVDLLNQSVRATYNKVVKPKGIQGDIDVFVNDNTPPPA